MAISKVQTAKAEALERLNEAKPSENVLKYKALEYFPEIANGRATKIIIPSEIKVLQVLRQALWKRLQIKI